MYRKNLQTLAIGLILTLAVSTVVSALGSSVGGGGGDNSPQATVLTYAGLGAVQPGLREGYYWTDILKEDLGIVLEFVPSSDENIQAYLASGDLPDLIIMDKVNFISRMIRAGLMVNLDEHKDRLPNLFANGGAMLRYIRDNVSPGRLDFVRTTVSNTAPTRGGDGGPHLRWDYYKELGYPEIVEFEDYLPVLKAMVDRHPLTEAGQRVYGISLWSDWDGGVYMWPAVGVTGSMGTLYNPGSFLELDIRTGAFRSFLDDGSCYKRALKFYFTANQMGILDPDSITQGWDTYLEKGTAGRDLFGLMSYFSGSFNTPERAARVVGTKMVPFRNEQPLNDNLKNYIGREAYVGVSRKTKNLDKALAFLDYYFSWDGLWQLYNGRRGVAWDLDENGEPYYTEQGWRIKTGAASFPNGGSMGAGTDIAFPAFPIYSIHPVYQRRIDGLDWIKKSYIPDDTALDADWKRVMNAEDDLDYFSKNNMLVNKPIPPRPTVVPEDIQILAQRVGQVLQPTSWKMVYAKDEAEFNALWADMVSQVKGIGIDRVNQWFSDYYIQAMAMTARYMY
jgi:putative aldouronate transport system substrate-binding protein